MKKKSIVYELALNERVRTLLRLEYLFAGIMYRLKGPAEWDSRAVINNLIEVLDILVRIDFKIELIKELENHALILERWQSTPDVDTERLTKLVNKVRILINRLNEIEEPLGKSLSQHNTINIVRQRRAISGGTCRCDLPGYHYWLQKNPKRRQDDINNWLAPLEPLREAIDLNLYLIRNNAVSSQETATGGFFQTKLDSTNANYHIIQVLMPIEHPCYPEMSGGKKRITIRFFEQTSVEERPLQTKQDVNFELLCSMT